MKRETLKTTTIYLLSSFIIFSIGFFIGDLNRETESPGKICKTYQDVGGNIDIEYYLEVSEDSIWVENVSTHRVYGGTYKQLDSLINVDNL